MTPGELIAKLRGDGITLRRDGESLRVTSNTGKIHAEIKSLILENKPALLEYLGSAAPGDGFPASFAGRLFSTLKPVESLPIVRTHSPTGACSHSRRKESRASLPCFECFLETRPAESGERPGGQKSRMKPPRRNREKGMFEPNEAPRHFRNLLN